MATSQLPHFCEEIYAAALEQGLSEAVDDFLSDHVLSIEEEGALSRLVEAFGIDLDLRPALKEKIVKGAILRDLIEGLPSDRVSLSGSVPFVFGRDEKIVWLFKACDYYEVRKQTHYVAGSQGLSFRIMRGVYYRVGATRGERITTENFEVVDNGLFAITNKHVLFGGHSKTFRIPLRKLVSCELRANGIMFYKEGANPKPQGVTLDDPVFAANLISHLQ